MSNSNKQSVKSKEKLAKKRKLSRNKGFIVVYGLHSCRCCEAEMRFRSEEAALHAWQQAGAQISASITDDVGDVHEYIDTFSGPRFVRS